MRGKLNCRLEGQRAARVFRDSPSIFDFCASSTRTDMVIQTNAVRCFELNGLPHVAGGLPVRPGDAGESP
jgi:hypothetical protein